MKCILLLSLLLTTACTTTNTRDVLYYSEGREEHVQMLLTKCRNESTILTLSIFEASPEGHTKESVSLLQRHLQDSCVRFYRLDI